MNPYYIRRTGRAILTIWLVMTLTFGLIRFLPGGPLVQLRGRLLRAGVDPSQIQAVIENYQGLRPDEPLLNQYLDYVNHLLHGNMGKSLTTSVNGNQHVAAIVGDALPWTILVMTSATLIMFIIGIFMGALMAYKEGSLFDSSTSIVGIVLSSVPFYILAILLVWMFGYQYNLFPARGRISPTIERQGAGPIKFFLDAVYHAALPILSVVITGWGVQALSMRGNSIQVLGKDYVRVARLRGLSDRRIATRYVSRNAILPMWTGLLTIIGFNLGGSVILEQVFSYPGVGYYMFGALEDRDYPLMMGIFLVITTAVVIGLYIADLTYGKLDPRVSEGGASEAY
ncbi:MAG: ABC transporter permease [Haloarculaceae archaeon]